LKLIVHFIAYCSIKWIILSQFMLELRERSEASSAPPSASHLEEWTFGAAAASIRQTIQEDFGEPLYPIDVMEAELDRQYGDPGESLTSDGNDFEVPQSTREEAGSSGAEV
jgi:hypothetical protein